MNLTKAKLLIGGFLLAVVAMTTVAAVGTGTGDNNFYMSGSVAVTAASATVRTTRMRQSTCDAWLFVNRDDADTIYINPNVVDGYNGDAQVSDINMLVVQPGESLELEDALIKEFKVIGSGDAELYWIAGCK